MPEGLSAPSERKQARPGPIAAKRVAGAKPALSVSAPGRGRPKLSLVTKNSDARMMANVLSGTAAAVATCCDPAAPPSVLLPAAAPARSPGGPGSPAAALPVAPPRPWVTTGLFPQTLVLLLAQPARISRVDVESRNVRLLRLATAEGDAEDFEPAGELSFEPDGAGHQRKSIAVHPQRLARRVRVEVAAAYDDFAVLDSLQVQGQLLGDDAHGAAGAGGGGVAPGAAADGAVRRRSLKGDALKPAELMRIASNRGLISTPTSPSERSRTLSGGSAADYHSRGSASSEGGR